MFFFHFKSSDLEEDLNLSESDSNDDRPNPVLKKPYVHSIREKNQRNIYKIVIFKIYSPSPINDNDNDNSNESGSESSSSVETSSDDGSKNEPVIENTNWSLSSFVKPDKPVEKLTAVPQIKSEPNDAASNESTKKSVKSTPKCLNDEIKKEKIGEKIYFIFICFV